MITKEEIIKIATKVQTSEENIAREYVQNLFLSNLYKLEEAKKLLFKGGTALRSIYKSPRYSEDLDFTVSEISISKIEDLLMAVFVELERLGLKMHLEEATKTTGGYLGKIFAEFHDYNILIKLEISLREKGKVPFDTTFIENDYLPNYLVFHLPLKTLAKEKINALLSRGKPRDYFDAYFLLRNHLLSVEDKVRLKKVLNVIEKLEINFKKELERFLPKSFHPIIKNLKRNLIQEIKRFMGD